MRILYYNNCWFTNVGEAFIDIGAMRIIENISRMCEGFDISLGAISEMTHFYINNARNTSLREKINSFIKPNNFIKNAFMPTDYLCADYIVLAGMFATKEAVHSVMADMLRQLRKRGCKVIFLGLGGLKYDEEEKKVFADFIQEVQPSLIITRDKKTYDMYRDYAECIQGIDCAFWVKEAYNPKGFLGEKYNISAFNYTQEPIYIERLSNVIRPFHFPYVFSTESEIIRKENIMLSDSPYDYLTLYANADKVYTDLVHATLISLMYGVPVKYHNFDSRRDAFESIETIKTDEEGFLFISQEEIENKKREIEKEIIKKLE